MAFLIHLAKVSILFYRLQNYSIFERENRKKKYFQKQFWKFQLNLAGIVLGFFSFEVILIGPNSIQDGHHD